MENKGIKSLLVAWLWFISLPLYRLSRSRFPADHLTAILITAEDIFRKFRYPSQVCTRWSRVNYAKMEPTKPIHHFRNSWSMQDSGSCIRL